MQEAISLSILAGGSSSRMGQDKGLMNFHGRPLILQILEQLSGLTGNVIVISNQPQAYSDIKLPVHPDVRPGLGPLGGLYTAMLLTTGSILAVVGCDMPCASLKLFEAELEIMAREGTDAVIPSTPDGLEPLHAIYLVSTCLPAIAAAVQKGQHKLINWFPSVRAHIMSPDETCRYTPNFQAFINLNTPEEFARVERSLSRANEKP